MLAICVRIVSSVERLVQDPHVVGQLAVDNAIGLSGLMDYIVVNSELIQSLITLRRILDAVGRLLQTM